MSKYSASDNSRIITEQVQRIHSSIHDGTLDKNTIDDALAKLSELASGNAESVPAGGLGGNSVAQNRATPTPHYGEPSSSSPVDARGNSMPRSGEPAEQYPLNPPAGNRVNQVDNRGDLRDSSGNPVSSAHAGDPKEAQAKVDTRRNPA